MSGKARRNRNRPSKRQFPWLGLVVADIVLLITGGVVISLSSRPRPAVTPQVTGAPKLVVDRTAVDEGYVKYNVLVRTTFRLTNVGDQPLEIMDAPVELVEGC